MENISYWEKEHFFKADVLIVGAGIVGLTAAIALKTAQPTLTVLVLERGFLPSGASTKNAGFACFGSISELLAQEKLSGTAALQLLVAKRWQGLLKLRKLLGDTAIGLEPNGGYEIFSAHEPQVAEACLEKIPYFNALLAEVLGEKEVYSQSNANLKNFGLKGIGSLIANKLEAQIDSGLMMKSLLGKAAGLGVLILNNCNVNQLEETENGLRLNTSQGVFKSKKAIIANNAFVNALFPNLAVKPGRGQVIVTTPIPNLKIKGTFHYQEGYYYFRNIHNRLLLGGGRNLDFETEETTDFGQTALVQNALQKLLSEVILPNTPFEIAHQWSGIMAFGPHLAPIIEEIKPHVFCAVRCNGMGVAIGCQTGQEAAEMLLKSL